MLLLALFSMTIHAQITTMFYGRDKVKSKKETAALYSVEVYPNYTSVTIELIPTKNRSRMNYWTSKNTVIKAGDGIELPIIGFLKSESGKPIVDTAPFSGDWGWDKVKAGQKYYFTMIFSGAIPPGITTFSVIDKGTNKGWNEWTGAARIAHGYEFENYTLNNPEKAENTWTEYKVKQNANTNNDGICGIYEASEESSYKLGCVKQNGEYLLIYLGSSENMSWWQVGDIKAKLYPSATTGMFKADWIMANKTSNSNCYICFDGGSMKTILDREETFYLKMYPSSSTNITLKAEKWSGTGFALNNGYIATNYHVIENAKNIKVLGIKGNLNTEYDATVISTDKYNDLAIIKINDTRFNGFGSIPYCVKTKTSEVGENVFVLGYPLTLTMGDEIKLSTGIVSAKTGFQGDVSLYQISAPLQPGNSGGPLFDNNGNLIGIVNSKHRGTENVSYAIKAAYLNNLAESSLNASILPSRNFVSGLSLSEKVKKLKSFTFMITCSGNQSSPNITGQSTASGITSLRGKINNPYVRNSTATRAEIKSITRTSEYTAIQISTNNDSQNGAYQWCNIASNTYIVANGCNYTMTHAEGIDIAPDKTYFSYTGQTITFTLFFPAIPISTSTIDLIESLDSEWKWYGIQVK